MSIANLFVSNDYYPKINLKKYKGILNGNQTMPSGSVTVIGLNGGWISKYDTLGKFDGDDNAGQLKFIFDGYYNININVSYINVAASNNPVNIYVLLYKKNSSTGVSTDIGQVILNYVSNGAQYVYTLNTTVQEELRGAYDIFATIQPAGNGANTEVIGSAVGEYSTYITINEI